MRLRFWLGFAAVLAIAAGSVIGALVVSANDRSNFESMQHEEAARSAHQAEAVAALSVGQLSSAAAFYQAETTFSRHEFDVVARSLLRQGALTGTALRRSGCRSRDRAQYERTPRLPDRRTPRQTAAPGAEPPRLLPDHLRRLQADIGAQPLGYDLGADPDHAPILHRARDRGQAAATPGHALLDRRPRASTSTSPSTATARRPRPWRQRRAALLGFAVGAFRVGDLAAAAISTIPTDVDVQLRVDRGAVIGAPATSTTPPRPRSTSPTAPGSSSSAIPTGPTSACRC